MFSLNNLNSVNSSIISNLSGKNNSKNINKNSSSCNSLQDEYISSAKVTDLISGVYSKEAEKNNSVEEVGQKKASFEEEYKEYCVLFYQGTADGHLIPVYYPPTNASYEVKKAWIETMKSLTNAEQHQLRQSVMSAVQAALGKPDIEITSEMYRDYLNSHASYEKLIDLFTEKFWDSKSEKYDPFIESVLNKFKTNYESYSGK